MQIQRDGKHMTWESGQPVKLSGLSISGSTASIVSRTRVDIKRRAEQSWIYRNKIIFPYSNHQLDANVVGIFDYPKGGEVVG